jgi:hypothetical protein
MPGENSNAGLGDYTAVELSQMTPADFAAAQARGFTKPLVSAPGAPVEERPAHAGVAVASPFPSIVTQPAPVFSGDGNVWGRKTSSEEFTVPSGQRCIMRPLQMERLLMEGVLDQVTRLDGLAQALVNQSQGLPPEKQQMPTREEFGTLLDLVNKITIMAVAEPHVHADDETNPVPEGSVAVGDIDLMDRIAILEHALRNVKGLDNFRNAG